MHLGKSFLKQADSRLCLPLCSPWPRPQHANMKAKLFPSSTPQPLSLASSSSTRFSPLIFLVRSTEAACTPSPAITNPLVDMYEFSATGTCRRVVGVGVQWRWRWQLRWRWQ